MCRSSCSARAWVRTLLSCALALLLRALVLLAVSGPSARSSASWLVCAGWVASSARALVPRDPHDGGVCALAAAAHFRRGFVRHTFTRRGRGRAAARRANAGTGAAESERARTRADGRRSERPSLARSGPEGTRVDCTRETRRRARVRYVRHYVATLCAGRDFPFG